MLCTVRSNIIVIQEIQLNNLRFVLMLAVIITAIIVILSALQIVLNVQLVLFVPVATLDIFSINLHAQMTVLKQILHIMIK